MSTDDPAFDRPASTQLLLQLQSIFAEFYPTNERALELAAQAGLAAAAIPQSLRPKSTWWNVLLEADRQLLLKVLFGLVRADYPRNEQLRCIAHDHFDDVPVRGAESAETPTNRRSGTALDERAFVRSPGSGTSAVLSFVRSGRVTFRCEDLGIEEPRELRGELPFAAWSLAYATGDWSSEALLTIGLAIGLWFDGQDRWLTRLAEAPGPIILTIETTPHPSAFEKAALEVPWELIALVDDNPAVPPRGVAAAVAPVFPEPIAALWTQLAPVDFGRGRHLAQDSNLRLTTVRRLGVAAEPPRPSPYRLSVVFMAAQPDGVANLEVESEEVAISRAGGGAGMDLAVEDSGSLDGLGEMVARIGPCDVIQVSCHGATRDQPVLVLEDGLGRRAETSADDITYGIGNRPRLLFLAVCSTPENALPLATAAHARSLAIEQIAANASAVAIGSDVLWPLSADLCRLGWPAVLGWSCSVTDLVAIELAAALYRQLIQHVPLIEAFANARMVSRGAAWHKARLFLGPTGGGKITDGAAARASSSAAVGTQEYLDPATKKIPVATPDQPFPYRRAFQRVMVALRTATHIGVIAHGGDERTRATFAGHVLQRLDREFSRVVVAGELDARAVLEAIRVQTANLEVNAIAERYRRRLDDEPGQLLQALREIIEGPCRNRGTGAIVLALHDFGPIAPNPMLGERGSLSPALAGVAAALILAFAGARTESRLLVTAALPFAVIDDNGRDLAGALLTVSLDVSAAITAAGVDPAAPEGSPA